MSSHRAAVSFSLWLGALAINLPAVTDLHHANDELNIGYGINYPVCSLADSILVVMAGEFLAAGRSWVGGQRLDSLDDAQTIFLGGALNLLGGRRLD